MRIREIQGFKFIVAFFMPLWYNVGNVPKEIVKMKEQNNNPNPAQPEKENNTTMFREIIEWVEVIAAAVIIALFLNNFILVNATVPSGSMENTIYPGDRLFGLRLTYLFSDPKRGDIVVFRYPVDESLGIKTNYIKRIIGLPGDTVEIRNANVYINGSDEPLDEPYLKEEWIERNDGLIYHVPDDSYFMMGDNRNNSSDSRYWQYCALHDYKVAGKEISEEEALSLSFVNRRKILGKAYVRYWPLNSISLLK